MIRSTHEDDLVTQLLANDESTRSQSEYSIDASGMQMRIYHAAHAEQERRQTCDA